MKLNFLLLLSCLIAITTCREKPEENLSINGLWESIGSGWLLEIQDSNSYALYDVTTHFCLPGRQAKLDEILADLVLEADTLSLKIGVITYKFTRTQQLPPACHTAQTTAQQKDPLYNFDVFAETVKEHYAFLQLNGINWEQLYATQKSKLTEASSEADLYLVIEETLEKLNDNHAYLEATEAVYEALEQQDTSQLDEDTNTDDLPELGDFPLADLVANNHLEEEMTQDSWLIKWGNMTDDLGYVQIKAMWLFAELDIPSKLIEEVGYVDAYVQTFQNMYEGDYIEKEVAAVAEIMDKIRSDLSDRKAIVIDVRFNGGGQDAVSFEILRSFITEKQQVATQKLRYGDHFSPTLALYISGKADAYTQPVYVLTSPQTGSAAEAFAIATISIDHIKRIGSPTAGAMSTTLEKQLPNGWSFAISNEIYMDNGGNNYENIGIPVDYDLNYPKDRQTFFRSVANDLAADKQNILNAIAQLEQQ